MPMLADAPSEMMALFDCRPIGPRLMPKSKVLIKAPSAVPDTTSSSTYNVLLSVKTSYTTRSTV